MKRSIYGAILMGVLATSGVSAEEVHLWCEGTYTSCSTSRDFQTGVQSESCSAEGWGRQIKVDEDAGTLLFAYLDSQEWGSPKNVKFGPTKVTGEIKKHWTARVNPVRAIFTLGKSAYDDDVDFSIDRNTGRLNIDGDKANCRVVEQKKLF